MAVALPLDLDDFSACPGDPRASTTPDAVIVPNKVVIWTEFAVVMICLARSVVYSCSFVSALHYQKRVDRELGDDVGREYGLQVSEAPIERTSASQMGWPVLPLWPWLW